MAVYFQFVSFQDTLFASLVAWRFATKEQEGAAAEKQQARQRREKLEINNIITMTTTDLQSVQLFFS